MPRQCTICSHRSRQAIDEALRFGVSATAIAETHHVATSSLYRHRSSGHIPEDHEQAVELEPETVGARLAELADDIRRERLTAQASNQKAVAIRAAAVELRVLEQISTRHGVEAVDALHDFKRLKTIFLVLGRVMQKHPELAARLIPELEGAGFDDLAQELQTFARKDLA